MGKGELDKGNQESNAEELLFQNYDCIKTTQIKMYYLDYILHSISVTWYIIKKLVCTDTTSALKLLNNIACITLDQQSMTAGSCGNNIKYMITNNKHDITTEYSKELVKYDPDTVNIKDFAKGKEVLECVQDDVRDRDMFFKVIDLSLAPT